jgi:predicted RecB family nuclease
MHLDEAMRRWRFAATDLALHVGCGHRTWLDRARAAGEPVGPATFDPVAEILAERGRVHEAAYRDFLIAAGRDVVDAGGSPEATQALIAAGADVIAQAHLTEVGVAGRWHGFADFLVRVDAAGEPAAAGRAIYEIHEAKLATETRAGAVLQLCVYADLLTAIQGAPPPRLRIVAPAPASDAAAGAARGEFAFDDLRFEEFAAIYRALRRDFEASVDAAAPPSPMPEPCAACETCVWWQACDATWRAADHLALLAGGGRAHRRELAGRDIRTLTRLAREPRPVRWTTTRATAATYDALVHQAALQVAGRAAAMPPVEVLPVEAGRGLTRLPAPSEGDVFLDLEGDPFIGRGGQEFVFGWVARHEGAWRYRAVWADDAVGERAAYQALLATLEEALERDPAMHVYHFAPYEPAALRRLRGATGEGEALVDRLLREQRFVDLMAVTRQALRVGVESYGLKPLEAVTGYQRALPLDAAGAAMRRVRVMLQRGDAAAVTPAWRAAVLQYNEDDCRSARALRDYLEAQRAALVAGGVDVPRPEPPEPPEPKEETTERRAQIAAAAAALRDRAAATSAEEGAALALLADLLGWYQREQSVGYADFYRRAALDDDERFDEPKAVSGLEYMQTVQTKRAEYLRYRYPAQELTVEVGETLYVDGVTKYGAVKAIDREGGTIDVSRAKGITSHASSLVAKKLIGAGAKEEALVQLGERLAETGLPPATTASLPRDLLMRARPRGLGDGALARSGERASDAAVRLASALAGAVLPIQGPPGTGKSTTAAAMIVALVRAGRRVGITATSHAVIANLAGKVVAAARTSSGAARVLLKTSGEDVPAGVEVTLSPKDCEERCQDFDVIGGTAWQWARPGMRGAVDVLFIDEAGQMSLTDALAVSDAARSLVLIGDPQQLEQPIQASHPDGCPVSVLEHLTGGASTIAPDRGLMLDVTYRLHPRLCTFTSEQYYAGRLAPALATAAQALQIASLPELTTGAFWLPVEHDGNQSRSPEEAAAIAALLEAVFAAAPTWTDARGVTATLTPADVGIIAPFNAHVAEVRDRLRARGLADVRVSTVDKFQGQEVPLAIYTMATSHPDDAPRGLEFLYSGHRLNVATSRARCAAILVASPRLLRPECRTPAHLRLASGLCRFVELATPLTG